MRAFWQRVTEYLILRKAARLDMAFYDTPAFYDRLNNALKENFRGHSFTFRLRSATNNKVERKVGE